MSTITALTLVHLKINLEILIIFQARSKRGVGSDNGLCLPPPFIFVKHFLNLR